MTSGTVRWSRAGSTWCTPGSCWSGSSAGRVRSITWSRLSVGEARSRSPTWPGAAGSAQGDLESWISAIPAVLREISGYHPDCGRLLPDALSSRGFRVDGAEARAALLHGASPGMDWPRLSLQAMTAPMLQMGLADQASLQAVSGLLDDPATRLWLPPMVSVWGRRN